MVYISSSKLICFFDIFHTDTGIASEKEWGINLLDEKVSESGQNEDGSTWYRESGEELGEKGFRCRWAKMGGKSHDGKSVWKETVIFFSIYVIYPTYFNKSKIIYFFYVRSVIIFFYGIHLSSTIGKLLVLWCILL